jgi:hypothetical protein
MSVKQTIKKSPCVAKTSLYILRTVEMKYTLKFEKYFHTNVKTN